MGRLIIFIFSNIFSFLLLNTNIKICALQDMVELYVFKMNSIKTASRFSDKPQVRIENVNRMD